MGKKSLLRTSVELSCFGLPRSKFKNWILRRLGHSIEPSARIHAVLVWNLRHAHVGRDSVIRRANVIKNVQELHIGDGAIVGSYNLISAAQVFADSFPGYGILRLEACAKISSRHTLDCSGAIRVGSYSSIAGHRTTILTHSTDLRLNAQSASPVEIGKYSFIGTDCLLLGGSVLPNYSALGAGSALTRSSARDDRAGLWLGAPASWYKAIEGKWFSRTETRTTSVVDIATGKIINRAFR